MGELAKAAFGGLASTPSSEPAAMAGARPAADALPGAG
jgi:hypothetical protein